MQALLEREDNDRLSEEAMLAIGKKISQELNNCAEEIKRIYQNSRNINSITAETIGHAIRQIPIAHFGETTHLWIDVINGRNPEMLASLTTNLRQCLLNNADVNLCLLAFIHCVLRDEPQHQFDEAIRIMLDLQPKLARIESPQDAPKGLLARTARKIRQIMSGNNRSD